MGELLNNFKSEAASLLSNKKNLINLLGLGILVLAVPLGVSLIRQQQIIQSRADVEAVKFTGANVETRNGKLVALKPQVALQLTSPLGPPGDPTQPAPSPSSNSSPSVTPTPAAGSTSSLPGPCQGKSAGVCDWGTRELIYNPDGSMQESITAYGKYWNWTKKASGGGFEPWSGNGNNLEDGSGRYAQGPCAGKPAGQCVWDTRMLYYEPNGDMVESITAYGKYWNWTKKASGGGFEPWSGNGNNLEDGSGRYAQGPCAGKPAGQCVWDTRMLYYEPNGDMVESITAYGKYWNWTKKASGGGFEPWSGNGNNLQDGSTRYGR